MNLLILVKNQRDPTGSGSSSLLLTHTFIFQRKDWTRLPAVPGSPVSPRLYLYIIQIDSCAIVHHQNCFVLTNKAQILACNIYSSLALILYTVYIIIITKYKESTFTLFMLISIIFSLNQ